MKYTPTEADRLTGLNVRKHRRLAGETAQETIERSGIGVKQSSFSRIELGQRALSLPEATKLAAHWNTTADKIFVKASVLRPALEPKPIRVQTEQQFLGNDKPALFAVPEQVFEDAAVVSRGNTITIDLDNPMPAEQYRQTVWLPYLEARYSNEQKAS
jgi:transcriptional regulator with XRE-family HTH domain